MARVTAETPSSYDPAVTAFDATIAPYASWNIERIRVVRRPMADILPKLSKWTIGKSPPTTKSWFHAYTEFHVRDPVSGANRLIALERNANLAAITGRPGGLSGVEEGINIDTNGLGGGDRTLGGYVSRSKEYYAEQKLSWGRYDLATNNCHHFAMNGLRANGIWKGKYSNWADQNASEVLPKWAAFISRAWTDYSARKENGVLHESNKHFHYQPDVPVASTTAVDISSAS